MIVVILLPALEVFLEGNKTATKHFINVINSVGHCKNCVCPLDFDPSDSLVFNNSNDALPSSDVHCPNCVCIILSVDQELE